MMCLGVFLLGSRFFGTLWASWTSWKSISFARLVKFPSIICSNKSSTSCSYSCPSATPMILMLECLKLPQSFLSLSSFFWILVSSFFYGWMFISSFCSKSLIWVLISFPSQLVPYIFCFISLWAAFTGSFILQLSSVSSVSILIISVLNSASNRLSISSLLNSFLEFWFVLSFWPYLFVLVYLLCLKGEEP